MNGYIPTEEEYLEFERLGRKLGIPVTRTFVTLEVTKDGKILDRYHDRSHTWNRNYWNYHLMTPIAILGVATDFGAGYLSFKRVSGSVTATTAANVHLSSRNASANSSFGIVVGTGTGAESFEGYILDTLVAHGTGAGQLSYAAEEATLQNYTSGTKTWDITTRRNFTNSSGGTIVIAETGIYAIFQDLTSQYAMICRDLLGSTVSVAAAAQLAVTYTISLTFPE